MTNIKLNRKQISELISYKKLRLNDDKRIEIFDDEIILNNKGEVSYITSVNIEFKEPKIRIKSYKLRYKNIYSSIKVKSSPSSS